ncbi:MAG: hypothetical protein IPM50_02615 [Acidobacteriota bacterium]|nr:MAG: hypothetical protein IPM50_02615 [Acidobacteriota bacterium]
MESKFVQYTGKAPIEVAVGEFRVSFRPGAAKAVEDPRFRMVLLAMNLFRSATKRISPRTPAPQKKTPAAKTPEPKTVVTDEPTAAADNVTEGESE